jgi:3-dehydroquinate synthetase
MPDSPHGSTWSVSAQREVHYSVRLVRSLLEHGGEPELGTSETRRLVVVDATVNQLYGPQIVSYFDRHQVRTTILPLRCAESTKDLESLVSVLSAMDQFQLLRRSEPIIAIGGGVLLDIVGLAASLHRRGVPYVRVPTTLLAAVDVSVAAKTGINFGGFRNRLGTYHPPVAAIIDPKFFHTLDTRQLRSGVAEILKMAIIRHAPLFEALEAYGRTLVEDRFQDSRAEFVMGMAIAAMIGELQPNLWEEDLERLVDFGHSFSPALEMMSAGAMTHGEAVILDIQLCCLLANRRGLLENDDLVRILALIDSVGLPNRHPLFEDPDLVIRALEETALHRDGRRMVPIPTGIGRGIVAEVTSREEVEAVVQRLAASR